MTVAAPSVSPDRIGRIYSYVRSNRDGSEAEHIHVYRASRDRIEVAKLRARCTDAAFVTAQLDLARGEPRRLVGGRLLPNADHRPVGTMTHDPQARRIVARFDLPDGVAEAAVDAPASPWLLYDFDFADLTVLNQYRADPRAAFGYGVALFWNDGDPREGLRWLGRAEARFERAERRDGREALRFAVTGPAFGTEGGTIWFDGNEGHVVAAEFAVPNHAEYRDFALRLTGINDGGQAAWRALLTAHFADCPTG